MITAVYAALLALLYCFLSVRVIALRRKLKIALGDSGDTSIIRAIRAHSNFAEYVPLGLLLIYFTELSLQQPLLIHALGICLLVGRLLHAFGVSQTRENFIFRVSGMAMTFTALLTSAACLLFASVVAG